MKIYGLNKGIWWILVICSDLCMIWSDICMIVLIFNIIYWQWICETQKTKDVETETFRDWIFWELSRPRLFETKKFKGCRDRDRPRLSKSCRDRDFFESLANLWFMQMHKVTCSLTHVVFISMQMDKVICTTYCIKYLDGWIHIQLSNMLCTCT